MDIGARYRASMGSPLLTLRAGIENLFDKGYGASAVGFPGPGYLVLANPRTFTVSGSLNF